MKKFIILLLIVLCLGCSKNKNPIDVPIIDIDDLIKAPKTIVIDSINFNLDVFLWRDFMPIVPPEGAPMSAVIHLSTADSSRFPTNIDADRLWVIDSNNVWETALSYNLANDSLFQLSRRASDGPKWETDIIVDAVVRVIQDDSIYHFIKAEDITIYRTE